MSVANFTRTDFEVPALPDWAGGFCYLMETNDRYQKIGYSHYPKCRAKSFANLPFAVWISHAFPITHRSIELRLHELLAHQRVRGEWYCLSSRDIAEFKTITELRSVKDLPAYFHLGTRSPLVDAPGRHVKAGPTTANVWYRADRDRWYITAYRKQVPLDVTGGHNEALAKLAAQRVLTEIRVERLKEEAAKAKLKV